VDVAAIVEGVGVGRVELDGLVVLLDRVEVLALLGKDEAAAFEGAGIVRLELGGLVVVGDGVVGVVAEPVGIAAAAEGVGKVRVQSDGLVEILDRAAELLLVEPGKAAIVEHPRECFAALASRRDDGAASLDGLVVRGVVVMAPFLELFVALRLRRRAHGGQERQDRNCLQHVTLPYPACRGEGPSNGPLPSRTGYGLIRFASQFSRRRRRAFEFDCDASRPDKKSGRPGACRCLPAIAFVLSHVSVIVISAANCGGGSDG